MKSYNIDNEYELIYMYRQSGDVALQLLIQLFSSRVKMIIQKRQSSFAYRNKDELYQLCMIKLIEALDSYRYDKAASFSSYYFTIIDHSISDFVKQQSRYSYHIDDYTKKYGFDIFDECGKYGVEERISADYLNIQFLDYVNQMVDQVDIKSKDRAYQILMMRAQGYSYQEIADCLKISKNSVDYILRKLRRCKDRID